MQSATAHAVFQIDHFLYNLQALWGVAGSLVVCKVLHFVSTWILKSYFLQSGAAPPIDSRLDSPSPAPYALGVML
jgi:hypothetical protein